MSQAGVFVAGSIAGAASIAFAVAAALSERTGPEGLVPQGALCCGAGQVAEGARCKGRPRTCATTQVATPEGCVVSAERIAYAGGRAHLAGPDWDGQRASKGGAPVVAPFELDAAEVTYARYEACVSAKACDRPPIAGAAGEPVRGVTPEQAEAFCRFADGSLPTGGQWGGAAMGSDARRFPWGSTGLVCRRAAYGLVNGPCSEGALGPELAGARPDGATADGALDLAGNVAEWTREPKGYVARGGSYRSRSAGELKTFSAESTRSRPDVGFRCAYPAQKAK
ncbi:MAG TPA: SUMF1/EgtB/PvdO family nonheme iron enzyme [Polyangiaceae bacterium]